MTKRADGKAIAFAFIAALAMAIGTRPLCGLALFAALASIRHMPRD